PRDSPVCRWPDTALAASWVGRSRIGSCGAQGVGDLRSKELPLSARRLALHSSSWPFPSNPWTWLSYSLALVLSFPALPGPALTPWQWTWAECKLPRFLA